MGWYHRGCNKVDGMSTAAERDAAAAAERAEMARDIAELSGKVEKLSGDIAGLVMAWQNANFALAAVKWVSGVVMAASALWFVLTHFGQGK